MGRRHKHEEHANHEAWAIPYGDLITLLYNVLGGELGARFLLKVFVVGAIAGSIFGYYLSDLRREEKQP